MYTDLTQCSEYDQYCIMHNMITDAPLILSLHNQLCDLLLEVFSPQYPLTPSRGGVEKSSRVFGYTNFFNDTDCTF